MSSFVGVVEAADGELLLGGRQVHESARFEKEHHAQEWADGIAETNAFAGRKVKLVLVVPNEGAPEVLASDVETIH